MTDRDVLAAFSGDYAAARVRFREAALDAGWHLSAHEIDGAGPDGSLLATDVADAGTPGDTRPVVLVSSGLHGVEGHFGSAVQLALLRAASTMAPRGGPVRLVLVHALNPYGFAWSRRTDDVNVDLNRAFRWPGMTDTATDAAYARLDTLLNPRGPASFDLFRWRLIAAAARIGPAALRRIVASGQRRFPRGLFYAGTAAPALQGWLDASLPPLVGAATQVTHLDLHTGLGRKGDASLILDYRPDEDARRWWDAIAPPIRLQISLDDPAAYTAAGSLGQWCALRRFTHTYRFAFAEFGTCGGAAILAGLRAENQAHHWSDRSGAKAMAARARLRELFCPADPAWRIGAARTAIELIARVASAHRAT